MDIQEDSELEAGMTTDYSQLCKDLDSELKKLIIDYLSLKQRKDIK